MGFSRLSAKGRTFLETEGRIGHSLEEIGQCFQIKCWAGYQVFNFCPYHPKKGEYFNRKQDRKYVQRSDWRVTVISRLAVLNCQKFNNFTMIHKPISRISQVNFTRIHKSQDWLSFKMRITLIISVHHPTISPLQVGELATKIAQSLNQVYWNFLCRWHHWSSF